MFQNKVLFIDPSINQMKKKKHGNNEKESCRTGFFSHQITKLDETSLSKILFKNSRKKYVKTIKTHWDIVIQVLFNFNSHYIKNINSFIYTSICSVRLTIFKIVHINVNKKVHWTLDICELYVIYDVNVCFFTLEHILFMFSYV